MNNKALLIVLLLNVSNILPAAAGAGGASSSSSSGAGVPILAVDRLEQIGVNPALFLQQLAQYIVNLGISAKEQVAFEAALATLIGDKNVKEFNTAIQQYRAAEKQISEEYAKTNKEEWERLTKLLLQARDQENLTLYSQYYQQREDLYIPTKTSLNSSRERLLKNMFTELMSLYYTIYGQLKARGTIPPTVPHPTAVQALYNASNANIIYYIK